MNLKERLFNYVYLRSTNITFFMGYIVGLIVFYIYYLVTYHTGSPLWSTASMVGVFLFSLFLFNRFKRYFGLQVDQVVSFEIEGDDYEDVLEQFGEIIKGNGEDEG